MFIYSCKIYVKLLVIIFELVYSYNTRECDTMIYPSIDKILNIVDSKYTLVYIASERSRQMAKTGYYQKSLKEYKSEKDIGRALEEVYDGLIKVEKK